MDHVLLSHLVVLPGWDFEDSSEIKRFVVIMESLVKFFVVWFCNFSNKRYTKVSVKNVIGDVRKGLYNESKYFCLNKNCILLMLVFLAAPHNIK